MNALLQKSAIELAQLIRTGSVSSFEVTKAFIEQAKRVNPKLNAIVKDCFEEALAKAKDVDKRIASSVDLDLPLLGVPFTIKEHFATKGLPQTMGLVSHKDNIAVGDAVVVARLKAAGAIPIGVTNVPSMLNGWVTNNKIYGKTYNPYNTKLNPGGSSGGEGAIVSSAGSAFGLGSDLGGSIRMPAFFCGLFGHKHSAKTTPLTGAIPKFEGVDQSKLQTDPERRSYYFASGPLCRSAKDLMPILKIIAGPDGQDPHTRDIEFKDSKAELAPGLKYFYINHQNIHPSVQEAQSKTIECLRSSGAPVQEIPLGLFEHSLEMFKHTTKLARHPDDLKVLLSTNKPFDLQAELEKEKSGLSDYNEYFLRFVSEMLMTELSHDHDYFQMSKTLKNQLDELLGDDGVLIYPTHPYPAITHEEGLKCFERMIFTGVFNMLGYPATAIPTGLNQDGLPVGLQAVATMDNDHLTISVAEFLESKGFRWAPPKLAL